MEQVRSYSSPLRERQTEDTRRQILEAALSLIQESPEDSFSHERIAARAGVALRTVYRHFPSRSDLLDAVWQESDHRLQLTEYPASEADLLASLEGVYGRMDENAPLIRGILNSNAGREMRRRDNERRLQGIDQALADATSHLTPDRRRLVIAVFQALFSARTWEMMRDRAHLAEGETAKAVQWAMETMLQGLHEQAANGRPDTFHNALNPDASEPVAEERAGGSGSTRDTHSLPREHLAGR
jgi:AcrR family transcriptional regulator